MRVSGTAILVIVVFAIVLFGAKRLPELARSLGQSMRILKSEAKAMKSDGDAEPAAPARSAPAVTEAAPAKTIQAAPGASATARPVNEQAAGDAGRPQ
ncbi:Sec-independent protein translocase subunit TatA [Kitasatospora sp. A2-31]|uniref:Sec-independent protein translocase subunit TatA n=1 Tax=Kitasatospora sp. A2-31 TaxID=2916414 RepID=UPI001EE8063B|nr:Sec-independent protein translocase subunit TatA [Kitasatospora sp. A2-31]MCG6492830.1 Sec-independent protein translocase subunit TatA [Kitasatospora sp. A2-31]